VRKLAWTIVILLLLVSAALFLRYAAIYAGLTDPEFMRGLRQIAASAHLIPAQAGELLTSVRMPRSQADLALYLGIATGLLATLAFIILAATLRLRRDEYEENDDDDPGPQTCPECDEPIKGFAITCRACGYGFGPRFESRGRRR
jgi:hypothetical protein